MAGIPQTVNAVHSLRKCCVKSLMLLHQPLQLSPSFQLPISLSPCMYMCVSISTTTDTDTVLLLSMCAEAMSMREETKGDGAVPPRPSHDTVSACKYYMPQVCWLLPSFHCMPSPTHTHTHTVHYKLFIYTHVHAHIHACIVALTYLECVPSSLSCGLPLPPTLSFSPFLSFHLTSSQFLCSFSLIPHSHIVSSPVYLALPPRYPFRSKT